MEEVTENIKDIYCKEMGENGPIADIKALHNDAAWQRQRQLKKEKSRVEMILLVNIKQ